MKNIVKIWNEIYLEFNLLERPWDGSWSGESWLVRENWLGKSSRL